ncbi:MAG: flagellar biosynthetic protein FliO [Oscillospiraceae bacterium]|nr:flagellar biosynthetic protein FliO [Oscillospiraceae bacterium]
MEVLSLLGILLVLLLVLGGCYLFTRWAGVGLGGRLGLTPSGGRLRVLERLPVGRDQALLVVEAANRHFLLGSSPSGLSLLAELTEEEAALWTSPPPSGGGQQGPDFRQWLGKLREKK